MGFADPMASRTLHRRRLPQDPQDDDADVARALGLKANKAGRPPGALVRYLAAAYRLLVRRDGSRKTRRVLPVTSKEPSREPLITIDVFFRNVFQGVADPDSSVTALYVGPRILASFGRVNGEVSVDLPVIMNATSFQTTADYRIRAGFTVQF